MFRTFFTAKFTRIRLEEFVSKHASEAHTLDIGCSHSPYSHYFPNRVGFDIQPEPGVDVVGDAHSLPFPDTTFDCIVCTEVLEHLYSPHVALAEMHRVLKNGGSLILTTRFIFPIHDAPNDFYRYTEYGLRHLLRDWKIEELEEEYPPKNTVAVLVQRWAMKKKIFGGGVSRLCLHILARGIFSLPSSRRKTMNPSLITSGYYIFAKK